MHPRKLANILAPLIVIAFGLSLEVYAQVTGATLFRHHLGFVWRCNSRRADLHQEFGHRYQ